MIDGDPQPNLSELFGFYEYQPGERVEDLLENPIAVARIEPPPALGPDFGERVRWRDSLRLLAATGALAEVAAELARKRGGRATSCGCGRSCRGYAKRSTSS